MAMLRLAALLWLLRSEPLMRWLRMQAVLGICVLR
jgi:hypothetical protein